jgi:hypothetical protein
MPDALLDQLLALPTEALCVFLVPGRHPHHAAHLSLAATESHQGAQQRVGINGVGLDPPGSTINLDACRIHHIVDDTFRFQFPIQPEPIVSGLVARDDLDRLPGFLLDPCPQTLDQGQEAIDIPGGKLVPADLVGGRRVAGDKPARAAQFQCQKNPDDLSGNGGRRNSGLFFHDKISRAFGQRSMP